MSTFEQMGFLSTDVDAERTAQRERFATDFAKVEALAMAAMVELKAVSGPAAPEHLVGLGFWLRSLECCQAAVLLIERGLPSAPFPVLRTAFECLFFACALWRKPELAAKLEVGHHVERIKQAKRMAAAGAAARLPPARVGDLESVADEVAPTSSGLDAQEAASAADLVFEYETAWRGFAIAGAHATLRSLDDYFDEQPDGSFELGFAPSSKRTAWLLGLVATCLACGIERHREAARSGKSPAANSATSAAADAGPEEGA